MTTGDGKRKIDDLSKGELDDIKDGAIAEPETDDRIEEFYENENDESDIEFESDDSDNEENDSLDDSDHDEFADGDTSDEEDRKNTIGNVPIEW